ncbi:MAG: hypothetical protein ACXWHG_14060 [Thermoanaerobaculia bacterium]
MGANGAGKSTLLRVAAGIIAPSEGVSVSRGTIAPVMELGTGFEADFRVARTSSSTERCSAARVRTCARASTTSSPSPAWRLSSTRRCERIPLAW